MTTSAPEISMVLRPSRQSALVREALEHALYHLGTEYTFPDGGKCEKSSDVRLATEAVTRALGHL